MKVDRLEGSLRKIQDQARFLMAEQGVATLYLGFGMLEYFEKENTSAVFKAPVFLIPAEITKVRNTEGYCVAATDDEAILNPSLVALMEKKLGIKWPRASDDTFESGAGLEAYIRKVREKICVPNRWTLHERGALAVFFFGNLVILQDIERNEDKIASHELIASVIERTGESFIGLPNDVVETDLDGNFPPEILPVVVDADTSQLRAIVATHKGHNLVIQGPPGTGKSQTIVNLIATSIASGKKVLFVAEKLAALEVVSRKLHQLGLSEFCLELHSGKANKKEVLKSLGDTMNNSLRLPVTRGEDEQALAELRRTLNKYCEAIHRNDWKLGLSPYEVTGRLANLLNFPTAEFKSKVDRTTQEDLRKTVSDIMQLQQHIATIGSPNSHPWRGSGSRILSPQEMESLMRVADTAIACVEEVIRLSGELSELFGLPKLSYLSDVRMVLKMAEMLKKSPNASEAVLSDSKWDRVPKGAQQIIEKLAEYKSLDAGIKARYTTAVLAYNPEQEVSEALNIFDSSNGRWRWFNSRFWTIRRRWKSVLKDRRDFDLRTEIKQMETVSRHFAVTREISQKDRAARDLFGDIWEGLDSSVEEIEGYVEWIVEFRKLCRENSLGPEAIKVASRGAQGVDVSKLDEVSRNIETLQRFLEQIEEVGSWSAGYFSGLRISSLRERLEELRANERRFREWSNYNYVADEIRKSVGCDVLAWIEKDSVPMESLAGSFERAFYETWIWGVSSQEPVLRDFNSISHEAKIREFAELDEKRLALNIQIVKRVLRQGIQSTLQQPYLNEEKTYLKGQINRVTRHAPIRKTMQYSFNLIRSLKPCFLMNPQAVAQFVDSEAEPFDLIIFDEASQVTTEDAVGSIIRGKQVCVVGDPKQLPPSSFFAVSTGHEELDSDDEEPDDSESILEQFMRSGVAATSLEQHYRSRYETLIDYSNKRFYEAGLVTFPSADAEAERLAIDFRHIESGVYEGKGLNRVEAAAVVDAVIEHAKAYPHLSLMVGTFGSSQQIAIQEMLAQRLRSEPDLAGFFQKDVEEPFEIKNLENLQGDERDVVMLSVTFGPDKAGKVYNRFGPLNSVGGWRRMNVIASRARQRMIVFSSMTANMIKTSNTEQPENLKGPFLMRDFLEFVESRKSNRNSAIERDDTVETFESGVATELERLGLKIVTRIGQSNYKIDFGVVEENDEERFLCAIELDGEVYAGSQTARERDRLRPSILRHRGWKIVRLWSAEWFRNKEGEIARLMAEIEQFRQGTQTGEPESDVETSAEQLIDISESGDDGSDAELNLEYQAPEDYKRPQVVRYKESYVEPDWRYDLSSCPPEIIRKRIRLLVNAEGPIHIDDVCNRLALAWGYERAGSLYRQIFQERIDELLERKTIAMDRQFLLDDSKQIPVRSRWNMRVPIERISHLEIEETIRLVLGDGHQFERNALINEVRAVLGYARSGPLIQERVGAVIDEMIAKRALGEGGIGIALIE